MQNSTDFNGMMRNITALPLWVKQVIYTELRTELEVILSKSTLDMFGPEDLLQLLVPEMTPVGNKELDQPSGHLSQDMLRFLNGCRQKQNIANICIQNRWTLEQTNNHLLMAINHSMVQPPKSGTIKATIDYLAGTTRLGEYLVKINRLTVEQLDQALRTQKYIEESMGDKTGIANVLINLGYIKKEDSEGILFLKEESKKSFEGFAGSSIGTSGSIGGNPPGNLPKTPPIPVQYPSTGGGAQQPQPRPPQPVPPPQQRPNMPPPGQGAPPLPPPGPQGPPLPPPGQGGGFPPPSPGGPPLPPPGQGGPPLPPPGPQGPPLPPPGQGAPPLPPPGQGGFIPPPA